VKLKLRLLAVCVALACAAPALADNTPKPEASAYFVQNATTGEVLLSHEGRDRVPIASITKLMTAIVALKALRPDEVVAVKPGTAAAGEASARLRPGERLTVEDLVEAALVHSANDAARALAVHAGGGDENVFVARMNATAQRLGMSDTHFVNPTGLDVTGQFSSARDVTILARTAMHQPLIRRLVRQRRAEIAGGRSLHGWNDLLGRFPGLLGVKTGHTAAAGWSQVAAARGRGVTIYASILGSPSRSQRNEDLTELLAWGLSRYRVVPAISAERTYGTVPTQFGREPVRLVAPRTLERVVRIDRMLVERVVAATAVELPVTRGQELGRVNVLARGKVIASSPLVAAAAIEKPDFLGRTRWYAGRTLDNAWGLVS